MHDITFFHAHNNVLSILLLQVHGPTEAFWIIVEDADGENVLHSEQLFIKSRYAEEAHSLTFYVQVTDPLPPQYFIRAVSDRWLQSETLLPVSFRHLLLPDKFPPPTELLDLAPLPVSALHNPAFEALYSGISSFNAIQTQAFPVLYESNANALVAAPSGAGKTFCAEFAMLRAFAADADARCVYVTPSADSARLRYEEWEARFGGGLGKAVVELTGELTADLKVSPALTFTYTRVYSYVSRIPYSFGDSSLSARTSL